MDMLMIIVGGICVTYLVVVQILDWMHLMEMIERRWPTTHRILMSPAARLLLLVVAIGLFAEVLREHRKPEPSSQQSGSASSSGDCSPAITGNGNKVDANCQPSPGSKIPPAAGK
jgi:hypothetical protein